LIAVRRRPERALPHMSWFHRQKLDAEEQTSGVEMEEGKK